MAGYKSEYDTLASLFNTGWARTIEAEPAGGGTEGDPAPEPTTEPFSPVQYENLPYTPVVGSKWARFTVTGGSSLQATLGAPGNNIYRFVGVINVQCFAPLNMGVGTAREMADKALEIFHGASQAGYFFRPGYMTVVRNSEAEGWYQVNAVIPFWRDLAQ